MNSSATTSHCYYLYPDCDWKLHHHLQVVLYKYEDTFLNYLDDYDVRFLGTDYLKGGYTGKNIDINI